MVHVARNIYPEAFCTSCPGSMGSAKGVIACMNNKNSSHNPYMCPPVRMTIKFFVGTNHPDWTCPPGSNTYGCASQPAFVLPTPLKSAFQWIKMREGKFRNNKWVARHETQHNYGYGHGSSLGNCGSFGNSNFEQYCCNNEIYQ